MSKKPPKGVLSIRICESLRERLAQYCKTKGITQTDFITKKIEPTLNKVRLIKPKEVGK